MTREECERLLVRAEKSQIEPSVRLMAEALRATLEREDAARDSALEEAAQRCDAEVARAKAFARTERGEERREAFAEANGMAVCADRIRALKGGAE